MLAMCVRKPGDTSGGSLQSLQTTTTTATVQIKSRKPKTSGLKSFKRGSKSDAERAAELSFSHQQAPPAAPSRIPPSTSTAAPSSSSGRVVAAPAATKPRDDPEGHLIYSRGDRLETRCTVGMCIVIYLLACSCTCAHGKVCTRLDCIHSQVFTLH